MCLKNINSPLIFVLSAFSGFDRRKVAEEVSLLERSKRKSTQYKDKWAVNVFQTHVFGYPNTCVIHGCDFA